MNRRPRIVALAAVLAVAVAVIAASSSAAKERRAPPKTKEVQPVSRQVGERLTAAHEALNAERYAEAAAQLAAILKSGKLNEREQSLVYRAYGYVYSGQEQYTQAIASFEKALAMEGLEEGAQLPLTFNLGQLYMLTEQYDRGITTLRKWFEQAENPSASAYILMANAYAQKEDYQEALRWANEGLARMEKPQESWMQLGAQLNLQLRRYQDAARWLERLVTLAPKKTYWMQLVAVYGELDRPRQALVAMEMAYQQGFLDKGKERERLAQLYMFNGVPYKAAQLLDEWLEQGSVEKTKANWELLANAWTLAQETGRAIPPLGRAARLSENGKLWVRLGQLHIEAERWGEAEQALREGIAKGGLDDPGQAQILLGITYFERERFEEATQAFQRARKFPKTARSASAWLETVASRQL